VLAISDQDYFNISFNLHETYFWYLGFVLKKIIIYMDQDM